MSVPSQMSLRRIPEALHLQVRIAYAAGWKALIATHTAQAIQFVSEFALRAPALRSLQLYFQVAAVPEPMQEAVWTQALTSLDVSALPPPIMLRRIQGWQRLRLDLVIDNMRQRKRYEERTLQLARMVGARAAEAVIATHVRNVLELARLLKPVLPVDQTTELYLTEFRLPLGTAQMVSQRVQAQVAGDQLKADRQEPAPIEWEDDGCPEELPVPVRL